MLKSIAQLRDAVLQGHHGRSENAYDAIEFISAKLEEARQNGDTENNWWNTLDLETCGWDWVLSALDIEEDGEHVDFLPELIFIREEGDDEWKAISEDQIETIKYADTYANGCVLGYGQDGSGDYGDLNSQEVVDIANAFAKENEIEEKFAIGDCVSSCDHCKLFEHLIGIEDGKYVCKEHFDAEFATCEGFTYWNGSNHHTIVIESNHPDWDSNFEKADDDLAKKLTWAYENEIKGFAYVEGKLYSISESRYHNDFEDFAIEESEDEAEFIEALKEENAVQWVTIEDTWTEELEDNTFVDSKVEHDLIWNEKMKVGATRTIHYSNDGSESEGDGWQLYTKGVEVFRAELQKQSLAE